MRNFSSCPCISNQPWRRYSDFLKSLQASAGGGWSVYQQGGSWSSSTAQFKRGKASGRLVQSSSKSNGKMIVHRKLPLSSGFVLEWDLYDDLDSTAFKLVRANASVLGGQIGIGVWTGSSTTHYAFHDTKYGYTVTSAARTKGWHKLGIRLGPQGVTYYVDETQVGSLKGQISAAKALSVEGYHGGLNTFFVDDIRLRRAAAKEPQPGKPGAEEKGSWGVY